MVVRQFDTSTTNTIAAPKGEGESCWPYIHSNDETTQKCKAVSFEPASFFCRLSLHAKTRHCLFEGMEASYMSWLADRKFHDRDIYWKAMRTGTLGNLITSSSFYL